jgi:hypothetical protein
LWRRHAGLAGVLALGSVLRVLAEVAYWPALYYPDSGAYVAQANGSLFSNPAQPGGYPLIIRLLDDVGLRFGALTILQHLAGLLTGGLVYLVTLRLSGRRWLATLGAAVVVLDAYAIAVEQYVMTDAFFGLMLTAAAGLALLGRRREWHVLSGLVLALACLVRPVGLFCVPVWFAYQVWRHGGSLTVLMCVGAVVLPLVGYAAANDARTGHLGLTEDTSWLLYARVAPIGECHGLSLPTDQRILCPRGTQLDQSAAFYMYSLNSPAVRAFGLPAVNAPPRVDRVLRGYALNVISQRPWRYLGAVASDFGAFFAPGAPSDLPLADRPITFPSPGVAIGPGRYPRRGPADLLRAYAGVLHTIRPLLALFVLMGIVALLLGRRRAPGLGPGLRAAIALLEGMGLALMVGAALSHFEIRYVLPAVPLVSAGGLLAAHGLWQQRRPWPLRGPLAHPAT